MKRINKLILTLTLALLASPAVAGTKEDLTKAYGQYKNGAYHQAIRTLNKIRGDEKVQATVRYWKGLCQARLQQYDKAVGNFVKAARLGSTAKDLYYEMGQSYYANQNLKRAVNAFKRSLKDKYKPGASAYYVGYLYQLLEKYGNADKYYNYIAKLGSDPDKVKQPALFQASEIELIRAERLKGGKLKKERLNERVIPKYERVIAFNDETPLARESEVRIAQIKRKHFGEVNTGKPWFASFGQKVQYDSNVVTQADEAVVVLSNTDAIVPVTTLNFGYAFKSGKLAVTPSLGSSFTIHSRRTVPRVYQNDQFTLTPSIGTTYQHQMLGKPATAMFDVDMDYTLRDYTQTHRYLYYSKYVSFGVGQKVSYFSFGPSTYQFKYKMLANQDNAYTADTPTIDLTQVFKTSKRTSVSVNVGADFQMARDSNNNLNTYRTLTTFYSPALFWGVTFTPSFNLSFYDTRNQSPSRGTEILINPSLSVSKSFARWFSMSLDYAYSNKISKDKQNYAYSQHVAGLGFTISL